MLRDRMFDTKKALLEVDANTSLLLRFNGDLKDESNHYTATMVGTPSYVSGVRGKALKSTHFKDYVSLPESAFRDLINHGSYTVECCFKFESTMSNQHLICGIDNGTTTPYYLYLYGNNGKKTLIFGNYDPGTARRGNITIVNLNLVAGTWYFVEVCLSGYTVNVFIDGVLAGSKTDFIPVVPSAYPFTIGGRRTNNSAANDVVIDELRLSNLSRHDANYVSPLKK